MKRYWFLLFAGFLFSAHLCIARERPPELQIGMSSSEVLTRAGAPSSKDVHEVKRDEIWRYNNYSVVFHEGNVVRLEGLQAITPAAAVDTQKGKEPKDGQKSARVRRSPPPDLMRTILKELPVPSASPGAGGVAPPSQLGIIPPQPPMQQQPQLDMDE